jgi:hypothetical protein
VAVLHVEHGVFVRLFLRKREVERHRRIRVHHHEEEARCIDADFVDHFIEQ